MKRSIKREIDDLGRITVPADFREELGIEAGDALEVYTEDGKIVYEKIDKPDLKQQIESLKDRINKAYQIAWDNDIPSPTCPEYEEMHNALKAIMDVLKGE